MATFPTTIPTRCSRKTSPTSSTGCAPPTPPVAWPSTVTATAWGVVTQSGSIIWPDRLLMLFAQEIIARQPGAEIIFDVKCSRHLGAVIERLGGRPCMWRTGHSHIKARLRESGAPLGGEFSGHICFADRWFGFDDALYAAARLVELLSANGNDADALFRNCPESLSTPEIKIETQEDAKFQIIEALARDADFGLGKRTTIDGVRVDYEDGWGLIRASNTSPHADPALRGR